MAGTLRETSGPTTPVTFSSGAASCSLAVTSGNSSGWSTLNTFPSETCSTTAVGGARLAGSAFILLSHAASPRLKARQIMMNMIRFMELLRGHYLPANGQIDLRRRGQIGADQIQIRQARVAIGFFGIEIFQQRSAPVSVGK